MLNAYYVVSLEVIMQSVHCILLDYCTLITDV